MKQDPYRINPVKQQILRDEVQYLLDNDFIEPSQSEWSSPCILVQKPDGTFRMCTDYRKVNSVTKRTLFPSHESMTASITLDKQNMLRNSTGLKDFGKYL